MTNLMASESLEGYTPAEHDWRVCYVVAISDEPSLRRERLVEKSLQLGLMLGHQAGGRRSRRGAADIAGPGRGRTRVRQHPFEIRLDEGPAPHVLGLLLAPDHLGALEAGEFAGQRFRRERIQLLDPQQIYV